MFYKIRVISDNLITGKRMNAMEKWIFLWGELVSVLFTLIGLIYALIVLYALSI